MTALNERTHEANSESGGSGGGAASGGGGVPGGAMRPILIVDDEPKTLLVSTDILAMDGYVVETARDGREALEKFEPGRHLAVVTDIRMPGMSGIELVEKIRARDEAVPIVILTGYATVETATRAVSAGAFEYLFKPIDFDKLKLTLRRAIDRYRLVVENKRLLSELTSANQRLEAWSAKLEEQVRARTRDLAYQRDLLENIVVSIPTGIAVVGGPGLGVASENAAFRRLEGAGRELMKVLARDLEAIAAGGPALRWREIAIAEPATGVEWALEVSAVALSGGRVLLVAEDRTEAARVEEELVQIEKLTALGTLAGGIVHDLANPITAILGQAELLLDDEKAAAARPPLEEIVAAARYMREVCGGLTEFARRARKGEAAHAAKVAEVVERAIGFVRHAKRLTNVEVASSIEEGLPPVDASAAELTQVLVNLIVNACDAMGGVGRLEIAARRAPGGGDPQQPQHPQHPRTVLLDVRDSGPGIPEPARARLFEPFFTTKAAGKGTGLGLYTSRRIVKRLGGRLDFTTGPGGTTFTIELPAAGN